MSQKRTAERIEIRHTPELKFIYDTSIAYGEHIDKIIEEINNNYFDLIMLDIMMPNMSGTETCTKIRETVSCPIIFVTAPAEYFMYYLSAYLCTYILSAIIIIEAIITTIH